MFSPDNLAPNRDRLVALTQRLVRINSEFSEGEVRNHEEMAAFLSDKSGQIGLEVHCAEPEAGYPIVMARLRGADQAPVLAFIGHYNTHPIGDPAKWDFDPLGGRVEDGCIWGRGAADMKKGIAAAIEATQVVMEADVGLRGDIVHIWFAGEGHHDPALEYMAGEGRRFAPADWYLDLDGPEGKIAKVGGPWVWLRLRTRGLAGHSGLFRGDGRRPVNAITKMVHLLSEIEEVDSWMSFEPHQLFGEPWRYSDKPIVEVGKIAGGKKVNEVPRECEAMVDFRLLPGQSPQTLLKELQVLVAELQARDRELEVEVGVFKTTYSDCPELTDDHPVVRAIREAAMPVLGHEPEWRGLIYGSRPALWEVADVIHYGVAGGRNLHAENECTGIDELVDGCHVYARLIEQLLT